MTARAIKRLELENNLRRGLERDQFMIHYQPQADLETGRIVGMEALVRWQHPELGVISPGDFIPLAEDTGLIMPLGEWVLRTACAQYKGWQEEGLTPLRMSVNVSARQFQQPNLVRTVARVLRETELDAQFLELELTEIAVMNDPDRAITTLRQLKEMGIKISIDDFGTGYSSLSYLKRFPIDVLKIDRSFVRDITTDPDDEAICMSIIELAHNLNLRVIAEGVETEAQLGFLRLLKCNEMQGYLFSKPLPAKSFAQLLAKGQYLGAANREAWEWWRLGDYAAKYERV
jgi:EAL domain-containing protein (putative c-di-GMP-specific phosphodiesterase class I)